MKPLLNRLNKLAMAGAKVRSLIKASGLAPSLSTVAKAGFGAAVLGPTAAGSTKKNYQGFKPKNRDTVLGLTAENNLPINPME